MSGGAQATRGRNAPLTGGATIIALLALACALAPLCSDPLAIDMDHPLSAPSRTHLLGTDSIGRDVLARLVHGGRSSLTAGVTATALAVLGGVALGVAAGCAGGVIDTLASRLADVFYAFPALIGAMALAAARPRGAGALWVGALIALFSWPAIFRFVRAEAQRWRASDVATLAYATGVGPLRLAVRHLVPLSLAPALVPAAFVAGAAVAVEASLGFLGLSVAQPWPTWGSLLLDGMRSLGSAWWLIAFPGGAIFATVLGCQMLGEGIRRALTPGRSAADIRP